MTTVGFGDIRSSQWYTDMLVICQMLLSVLYTTVIFSKGLSHFAGSTLPFVKHDVKREKEEV